MRNFFLFILLINLLAFAYQTWIMAPAPSAVSVGAASAVPELQVARLPAGRISQPAVSAPISADSQGADTPLSAVSYRCMRIGPFPRETDADKVRFALQKQEATVRQTPQEGQVWVGYWVQTAGQGSRSGAEKARAALIKGGMPDIYILSDSENFRISLGVFRQRASADKIMRDAREIGFDTRIIERYQAGTNFWLEVRMPGDRSLQPGDLRSGSGQILRTENIPCAEAGV